MAPAAASPSTGSRLPSTDPHLAAQTEYDFILIGLGVVGSALASSLASSNRSVLAIERDLSQPDRIVGELLQPGGCLALRRLGLLNTLEHIGAVRVGGYTVYWGDKPVKIPYPPEKDVSRMEWKRGGRYRDWVDGTGEWEGREGGQDQGWSKDETRQEGRSFHHGRFVQSLRRRAIETPRVTVVEATANELLQCEYTDRVIGVSLTPRNSPDPIKIFGKITIIIDGCFSKFRRQILPPTSAPIVKSNFVGLVLKDADLPSPGDGHVILNKDMGLGKKAGVGPILVYQIGDRETRMLVDVPGKNVPSFGNGDLKAYLSKNVTPALPPSLVPSFHASLSTRPRSMPNSYLPASTPQRGLESCLIVGDALNMRHPLTGGGMTVGLNDVLILTELLSGGTTVGDVQCDEHRGVVDLDDWHEVCDRLDEWHVRRKGISTCVNVLAQALYSLFGADDEYLELLKTGCFAYFERGGQCVAGPVSLLSALHPSPLTLLYHFFDVAFYAIFILFYHPIREMNPDTSGLGPKKVTRYERESFVHWPVLMWKSIMILYTACVVILPVMWQEF